MDSLKHPAPCCCSADSSILIGGKDSATQKETGKQADDLNKIGAQKSVRSENGCNGVPVEPVPMTNMLPLSTVGEDDLPCCGPPAGPPSGPDELPGYQLCSFVDGFKQTPIGRVPRVNHGLLWRDHWGTVKTRLGIGRDQYKVAPGLYCMGDAGPRDPVLVTANYKLTFDVLRHALTNTPAWLLVLDTRGINVWCAAGKKTFSTAEVVRRVRNSGLSQVVEHRRLILPQLGATGVSAPMVKKSSGFEVVWGPIRVSDIKTFLRNDRQATPAMRRVTVPLAERLVLIPLEIAHVVRIIPWLLLLVFGLSGIGSDIFSFSEAWRRGWMLLSACLAGIVAGTVAAPLLLPWLPARAFAVKGVVTGGILGFVAVAFWQSGASLVEIVAMLLMALAFGSYLAMNFTGATPFTSPSGVEKEMRKAIPLQAAAVLMAVAAWVGAGFME